MGNVGLARSRGVLAVLFGFYTEAPDSVPVVLDHCVLDHPAPLRVRVKIFANADGSK